MTTTMTPITVKLIALTMTKTAAKVLTKRAMTLTLPLTEWTSKSITEMNPEIETLAEQNRRFLRRVQEEKRLLHKDVEAREIPLLATLRVTRTTQTALGKITIVSTAMLPRVRTAMLEMMKAFPRIAQNGDKKEKQQPFNSRQCKRGQGRYPHFTPESSNRTQLRKHVLSRQKKKGITHARQDRPKSLHSLNSLRGRHGKSVSSAARGGKRSASTRGRTARPLRRSRSLWTKHSSTLRRLSATARTACMTHPSPNRIACRSRRQTRQATSTTSL